MLLSERTFDGASLAEGGETASLAQVYDSTRRDIKASGELFSGTHMLEAAYDRRNKAIFEATGERLDNPLRQADDAGSMFGGMPVAPQIERAKAAHQTKLNELAERHPHLFDVIRPELSPAMEAEQMARDADARAKNVWDRSQPGAGRWAAWAAGSLAAGLTDPVNLASLAVGGETALGVKAVLWMGLKQGAANAGTEAVAQPFIQSWRKQAGLSHGWQEAAGSVAFAGLFGFAADAGVRGLYRGGQRLAGRVPILDEKGNVTGYKPAADPPGTEVPGAVGGQANDNLPPRNPSDPLGSLDAAAAEAAPGSLLARAAAGEDDALIELARKSGLAETDPAVRGAVEELERRRDLFGAPPDVPDGEHYARLADAIQRTADPEALPPGDAVRVPAAAPFSARNAVVMQEIEAALRDKVDQRSPDAARAAELLRTMPRDGAAEADGRLSVWKDFVTSMEGSSVREAGSRLEAKYVSRSEMRQAGLLDDSDLPRSLGEADLAALLSRDPVDIAAGWRAAPETLDPSLPLTDTRLRHAVMLSRLDEAAWRQVMDGSAPPELASLVGEHVTDAARQAGLLRELVAASPRSEAHARRILGELMVEPRTHELRGTPPDDAISALRSDPPPARLAEPHGPVAKAEGDRLAAAAKARGKAEIEAVPPEAALRVADYDKATAPTPEELAASGFPRLADALVRAELSDLIARLPEGTGFRTFDPAAGRDLTRIGQIVDGAYSPSADTLYLGLHALDRGATFRHEEVHALRNLDLFTREEWGVLTAKAEEILSPERKAEIETVYREQYAEKAKKEAARRGVSQEQILADMIAEEKVAALIEERHQKGRSFGAVVDAILDRIAELMERLRNALAGHGYQSFEDVRARIETGEVGARRAMKRQVADGVTLPDGTLINGVSLLAIRAYHGSPHDFDTFSLDHIGRGEGVQAFGPGLYFTETLSLAQTYRDKLSHRPTAARIDGVPVSLGSPIRSPEARAKIDGLSNELIAIDQRIADTEDVQALANDLVRATSTRTDVSAKDLVEISKYNSTGLEVPGRKGYADTPEIEAGNLVRWSDRATDPLADAIVKARSLLAEAQKDASHLLAKIPGAARREAQAAVEHAKAVLAALENGTYVKPVKISDVVERLKQRDADQKRRREVVREIQKLRSDRTSDAFKSPILRDLGEDLMAADTFDEVMSTLSTYEKNSAFPDAYTPSQWGDAATELRQMRDSGRLVFDPRQRTGGVYQVSIDIPEEQFLLFDEPLFKQSSYVTSALKAGAAKALGAPTGALGWLIERLLGNAKQTNRFVRSADSAGAYIQSAGDREGLRQALVDAGIPGIKYLDGFSRQSGEGTYNYVVLDDSRITITHKDGVPVKPPHVLEAEAAERVDLMSNLAEACKL